MEDEEHMEENEGEILLAPEKEEGRIEEAEKPSSEGELAEQKDRYLRLYAEFENFKRRVQRDKEDLVKYSKEEVLYNLLPVIDNLEMALGHSGDGPSDALVKGVEITLREFQRVTEKFGLAPIYALDKPFDPALHHAMTVAERDDVDDMTVVEEFRKGYMFGDKVLRPSLVAVSKRSAVEKETKTNIETEED
ncbi:MAG TPA: nucleotide exchange factor GrpE [Thermodesulfovibrionales bacterium]|nr:nucleotide exchange factor GrpE [Thermodesulfovibrionales bacterium]